CSYILLLRRHFRKRIFLHHHSPPPRCLPRHRRRPLHRHPRPRRRAHLLLLLLQAPRQPPGPRRSRLRHRPRRLLRPRGRWLRHPRLRRWGTLGGGYGYGVGGPAGGSGGHGVVPPSMVCSEKGPCYKKKLTCPSKCFTSFTSSGKGYGGGGGGGGCTFDCKKNCVAYC
uniref:Twist-related protein 1-like n=1 Tax=Elaeis guineensis var. tenera TaxID=51953 RepID=A0A8N4EWP8_ELAGV